MARAFLSPKAWSQHLHLVGPVGSGKSWLIANLVLQDLAAGRAAVVIDPTKGDLYTDILARIPAGLEHKVCVIDPTDAESAVGINILASSKPDLAADHAVALFRRLYASSWGDRLEDYLRYACLTLARVEGAVLLDIPQLLQDRDWRDTILGGLDDGDPDVHYIRQFWREFDRTMLTPTALNKEIRPLTYKLRTFIPSAIRPIVAQRSPRTDPFRLVDEGGLILVRAPVGELGENSARILGAVTIARFWDRIAARSNRAAKYRRQATLYADELHEFVSDVATLRRTIVLGRGLNGVLVGAHQYLGQLPPELAGALAQVGTKACFALPPDDAKAFGRHFEPRLGAEDLQALPPYHVALRLPVGQSGRGMVVVARTRALRKVKADPTGDVLAVSGKRWARPRGEVEAEIRSWSTPSSRPSGDSSTPPDGGPKGRGRKGSTGRSTGRSTSRLLTEEDITFLADDRNGLHIRKNKRTKGSDEAGTASSEELPDSTPEALKPPSEAAQAGRGLRLTERDRAICRDLREHGVLSAEQIATLHFPGVSHQAWHRRLAELADAGLITRFRPEGEAVSWRYVLSSSGANKALHQRGWRAPDPSPEHLPHRLAANDFFTSVARECAARPGWRLAEWLGERSCRERWGRWGLVPDGYGMLEAGDRRVTWFLEVDRGTEGMDLVADKIRAYAPIAHEAPVLFCVTDDLRARRVLQAALEAETLVGVARLDAHLADPFGPNWQVGGHHGAVDLTELARPPVAPTGSRIVQPVGADRERP